MTMISVLSGDSSPGMRRRAEKHGREKKSSNMRVTLNHGEIKQKRPVLGHCAPYLISYSEGLIIAITRTIPTNRRAGRPIPIRRTNEAKWEKKLMHILKIACEEARA